MLEEEFVVAGLKSSDVNTKPFKITLPCATSNRPRKVEVAGFWVDLRGANYTSQLYALVVEGHKTTLSYGAEAV